MSSFTTDMDIFGENPVTEQRNPITFGIDVASSSEIVQMLHKCDKEIFDGWRGSKGLFNDGFLRLMDKLADQVAALLKDSSDNVIILSGSGTSGRLAFMAARTFNSQLASRNIPPRYDYLMSGGDRASFQSREAPEDDPMAGRIALEQACAGKQRALLIGITCGLSAAFVAGQLDACMDAGPQRCLPALLGFNPLQQARRTPVENWNKTFYTVAQRMAEPDHPEHFTMTPVIGPEPISGSTRMKSGTATKIILETILTAAHQKAFHPDTPCSVLKLMEAYRVLVDELYADSTRESLAAIITMAGSSLKSGGHIYYLAADSLGIVAMIDASECPPTFGADLNDIRGFFTGGYTTLANKEGDLSEFFAVSTEYFEDNIVPDLSSNDLIVFLVKDQSCESIAPLALSSDAKKVVIRFGRESRSWPDVVAGAVSLRVPLPWQRLCRLVTPSVAAACEQLYCELACKLACNAISTGAHLQRGKVYENVMVDVKVSNTKLFHRAVGIIELFAGCGAEEAKKALLTAVYGTDELTPDQTTAPLSVHIRRAAAMRKVVPVALVTAVTGCSVGHARSLLRTAVVIRTAIGTALSATLARDNQQGPPV